MQNILMTTNFATYFIIVAIIMICFGAYLKILKNTPASMHLKLIIPGVIILFFSVVSILYRTEQDAELAHNKAISGEYVTYVNGLPVDGSKITFLGAFYEIDEDAKEICVTK